MAIVPPGATPSYGVTVPTGSSFSYGAPAPTGGGGFFSNFKFSDLMPVAAAGLGGVLAGRTADNYGRSMLAAQGVTADAALGTAMINANLGKDMARFGLNLDQQAAQRNWNYNVQVLLGKLLATRAAMGETGPGFEDRAATRIRMFG